MGVEKLVEFRMAVEELFSEVGALVVGLSDIGCDVDGPNDMG